MSNCVSCNSSKSGLNCGACGASVCKSCAQFVDDGQFSFLPKKPEILSHTTYCPDCFNGQVAAELDNYNAVLEKAKEVLVFDKSQGKETRLIKRTVEPVKVNDCADYDEAILRIAFVAAQKNFNSIVDVNLTSKKVRNGSYQTTLWSGSGVPANVSSGKLVKDRSIWDNPN